MGRHKEWRKMAKKMRRKRIRSTAAAERDEAEKQRLEKISSTPYYKAWLAEQEALEEFREQEERKASILAHEKWVYLEACAQERWIRKQKLLIEEEAKRKEQEALIKREWEKEQEKERLEKEAKEAEEKRKKQQYERLMEQMDSFIGGSGAKPESLYASFETNPGREACPFFSKVGACRFRDSCSRNHQRPGISSVIVIPGFYSHFSLEIGVQGEYDTDINLEFDQSERFRDFKEFFEDVTPELEKFGPIVQFRVCSNTDPHLRGNVYVAYNSERAAAAAYKALNGRFYAGRMLNVEFVNIPSWKNAICGLQYRGSCPKGSKCNFLHVFRNPNNLYSSWDTPVDQRANRRSPERDDWRWTPSPERDPDIKRERSSCRQKRLKDRDKKSTEGSRKRSRDRHRTLSLREQSRDSQRTPNNRPDRPRISTPRDQRHSRDRPKDSSPSDSTPRDRRQYRDRPRDSSPSDSTPRDLRQSRDRPRDSSPSDTISRDRRQSRDKPRDSSPSDSTPRDLRQSRDRPRDSSPSDTTLRDQRHSRDRPRDSSPSDSTPRDLRQSRDRPRDSSPSDSTPRAQRHSRDRPSISADQRDHSKDRSHPPMDRRDQDSKIPKSRPAHHRKEKHHDRIEKE